MDKSVYESMLPFLAGKYLGRRRTGHTVAYIYLFRKLIGYGILDSHTSSV